MKFFYLSNWMATAVTATDDVASIGSAYPSELCDNKDLWRAWCGNPATKHCFYSCAEGVNTSLRVNDANPVYAYYGLTVDYDSGFDEQDCVGIKKKHVSEWLPQFASQTFSRQGRLCWAFERKVLLSGPEHAKAFADIAAKHLKLKKVHGGFDEEALRDSSKYYDIGRQWWKLSDDVIPSSILEMWSLEALKRSQRKSTTYEIPMEIVAAEVEKRWPGRWRGVFQEGARGVRFWDPNADNDTAAVVMKGGMFAFTGDQPFTSWQDIFGPEFIKKFEADQIASVVENTWYDGRSFWVKRGDEAWITRDKGDFTQFLKISGYDSRKLSGKTYSRIDEIENHIKTTRHVDAAVPLIYRPTGAMDWNNLKLLNISRVKCMEPLPEALRKVDPTFDDLGEHCGRLIKPWLECFMGGQNEQLWHFLAWLKYAYVNAWRGNPQRGQSILLVGPASAGKTFCIQGILTPLFGGRGNGGRFLSGDTKFSSDLVQSPLIVMDDDEGVGNNPKDVTAYTQRIKAIVANGEIMFAKKFGAEMAIEWLGRLIICCNFDPHAIARSMPDLSLSSRNKISMFLVGPKVYEGFFGSIEANRAVLQEELPWFASWLTEWNPPACTEEAGEHRFGVKAWHHPELLAEAGRQGYDELAWNVIVKMMEQRQENFKLSNVDADPTHYEAEIVQFHADLVNSNAVIMRDLKVQVLRRCLQSLMKKGRPVSRKIDSKGREVWVVDVRNE